MNRNSYWRSMVASCFFILAAIPLTVLGQSHGGRKYVFKPKTSVTEGTVTVEGHKISYKATASNIYITNSQGDTTARMFFIAYTKNSESRNKNNSNRPITFFWNGGPGSASVWIHMGGFGPRRVKMNDHTHTPPAPYQLLNNNYSLLDVTDEVFVDAVGTGFSRLLGKKQGGDGEPSEFYGINADAHSFAQFIRKYLSKYNRWNSPKYIYGESYGTTRAALLSDYLERNQDIDLNGVILQSSILDFHTDSFNAGNDLPYELFLPSYTAVAWYHHMLPDQPAKLVPLLDKVKYFALHGYAEALAQGDKLSAPDRNNIVSKLHDYTGLPESYIKKANLRVTGSEFGKELLADSDKTTGRLDARFTGPTMDPLSQTRHYDPHSAAFSSAYISLFNQYVHNVLKYGKNMHYRPFGGGSWDWKHPVRTYGQAWPGSPNVAVNLTQAIKYDPHLKVLVNNGYFDLGTPFFATDYTIDHMNLPKSLQGNIQEKYYMAGHMMYQHIPSLKRLHDNVATFIRKTDNLGR